MKHAFILTVWLALELDDVPSIAFVSLAPTRSGNVDPSTQEGWLLRGRMITEEDAIV